MAKTCAAVALVHALTGGGPAERRLMAGGDAALVPARGGRAPRRIA